MKVTRLVRDYHRYRYEQKIPLCIRNKVKEISLHQVINERVAEDIRRPIPKYVYNLMKLDRTPKRKIELFIIHAFSEKNTRLIRVVFNRFFGKLLALLKEGRISIRFYDDRAFKIHNYQFISNNKKHNNWYTKLKNNVDL